MHSCEGIIFFHHNRTFHIDFEPKSSVLPQIRFEFRKFLCESKPNRIILDVSIEKMVFSRKITGIEFIMPTYTSAVMGSSWSSSDPIVPSVCAQESLSSKSGSSPRSRSGEKRRLLVAAPARYPIICSFSVLPRSI